jgi:hypothetical protein
MAFSGFVDLIVCKMDFTAKQNVTKFLGVSITHTAVCQPANHAHRFKKMNALDMVRIQSFCV